MKILQITSVLTLATVVNGNLFGFKLRQFETTVDVSFFVLMLGRWHPLFDHVYLWKSVFLASRYPRGNWDGNWYRRTNAFTYSRTYSRPCSRAYSGANTSSNYNHARGEPDVSMWTYRIYWWAIRPLLTLTMSFVIFLAYGLFITSIQLQRWWRGMYQRLV